MIKSLGKLIIAIAIVSLLCWLIYQVGLYGGTDLGAPPPDNVVEVGIVFIMGIFMTAILFFLGVGISLLIKATYNTLNG